MRIKGTMLRARLEFLSQRFGAESVREVLARLTAEERRLLQSALPGSWIPFALVNHLDEEIVRQFGHGDADMCRDIGAFSAAKNLTTVYKAFVDQAKGDPNRLLESFCGLHTNFYDWGSMRTTRSGEHTCLVETDYEGEASRTNCLSMIGFYGEALRQLEVKGAQIREQTCQTAQAPLCTYEVTWEV